ncbi:MAG: zinc ABC transporter substrate-binding protein [Candidatus Wallbacteria bacterium]
MKKITIILFFCLFTIFQNCNYCIAAPKNVILTFFPLYIHALNIAGDKLNIEILLPPGVGIHHFSAKPSDLKKIAAADIVIKNGAGLDDFVNKLIESSGNTKITVIDASEGIETIKGQASCSECSHSRTDVINPNDEKDNHAGEHSHAAEAASDPHTWISVKNSIKQSDNILNALIKCDPANAEYYKKNAAEYTAKLKELDKYTEEKLKNFKGRKFIVYHGPFAYFAKDYSLEQYSIAGITGTAPAPSKLKEIYDIIKNEKIKFLVSEPAYRDREIKAISEELKLFVTELDPVETYSKKEDFKNYFIDRMKENADKLSEAFNR